MLLEKPSGCFTMLAVLLISGVVFVNGFTDAPNSVSGVVSSGIWKRGRACLISGIFNMLGVVVFSLIGAKVANGVADLSDFDEHLTQALCASLIGVIIFGVIAWAFAMPSSESHALVSCIFGASLASSRDVSIIPFLLIIAYMVFSCVFSIGLAVLLSQKLKKSEGECVKYEKNLCILSSVAHGAQDGQKLVALYALLLPAGALLKPSATFFIALTVGSVMMAGTIMGSGKIIESLGNGIVENSPKIAFLSDFSSTVCVFICSFLGFSVSTGNIKACSLIGAGLGCGKKINYATVKKIMASSVITFPVCIALGFLLTKFFMGIT